MRPKLQDAQNISQFCYIAARLETTLRYTENLNRGLSKRIHHLNEKLEKLKAENEQLKAGVDRDMVTVLIDEAEHWIDLHEENATDLANKPAEISFHCLPVLTVREILEDIRHRLLEGGKND